MRLENTVVVGREVHVSAAYSRKEGSREGPSEGVSVLTVLY